jgi:hypothetical protein
MKMYLYLECKMQNIYENKKFFKHCTTKLKYTVYVNCTHLMVYYCRNLVFFLIPPTIFTSNKILKK